MIEKLEDLQISIKGEITASNFEEWQSALIQRIDATNTELVTDEDFANADDTVKFYKVIEKRLDQVKQSALDQSRDINTLFEAIDSVKDHVKDTRLILYRLVKKRKDDIRLDLITTAIKQVRDTINDQEGVFPFLNHTDILEELDFELAIKGKRSISIAQSAMNRLVKAKTKEIDQRFNLVALNERLLSDASEEYEFLFHDRKTLLLKATDQLEILISNRILDYKEKERLKKEQERIQKVKEEQIRREKELIRQAEKKQDEAKRGELEPKDLEEQKNELEMIDPVEYEIPTDVLPAPATTFDKDEFITALKYMADGKNPFSGQSFPHSSSLNNVDFVRVLYCVIEELEN